MCHIDRCGNKGGIRNDRKGIGAALQRGLQGGVLDCDVHPQEQGEAEDVVQDAFITAYESYDTLKDKTKAVAWVKTIAANKCLNIVTRRRSVDRRKYRSKRVHERGRGLRHDFPSVFVCYLTRMLFSAVFPHPLSGKLIRLTHLQRAQFPQWDLLSD